MQPLPTTTPHALTPGPGPAEPLKLTTTVPREFVHRAALAEVLLTGWEAGENDTFTVHSQWPRWHSLFTPVSGLQDPMLVSETIRQTGTLLAHAAYGVPLDHQFLMWELAFSATPEGLLTGPAPTEVDLHVACHDIRRHGGKLSGLRLEATLVRDGQNVASGTGAYNCTAPAVYRRLRGERPRTNTGALKPAVDPALLGRSHIRDVLLAPPADNAPYRWELRADTTHPILFDHPVDHVPGMALLEAARQAAQAVSAGRIVPVAIQNTFSRYAELDAPCWIEAEPGDADGSGRATVRVTGEQDGEQVFASTITTWPVR